MSTNPMTARQYLLQEVSAALGDGAGAEELVDLVIRSGWQQRPLPAPGAEHLEGLLADGRRVPIEIRPAALVRAG